jgi:hypothetical protein
MNAAPPSAVIDKSLLQEICGRSDAEVREYLAVLCVKYQLVVPVILLEETLVSVASSRRPNASVERLAEVLVQLRSCWMDDVYEIAYRELVEREQLKHLPPPPREFAERLLKLKKDDRALEEWLAERERDKAATITQRRAAQAQMIASGDFRLVEDEASLACSLTSTLGRILRSEARKNELLETILGQCFRARHQENQDGIDTAFRTFTADTFTRYPLTLNCLAARLFYVWVPLIRIRAPTAQGRILGRGKQEQWNNLEDEQYVIAGMTCQRLLTRDSGMAKLMGVMNAGRLTKCQALLVDRALPSPESLAQSLR